MNILDLVYCDDCEQLKVLKGRTQGDPDECYPDEVICLIDADESKPCEAMQEKVHDMILDGSLETKKGYFIAREDVEEEGFDFSSAPYWLITFIDGVAIPFKNIEDVIREVF